MAVCVVVWCGLASVCVMCGVALQVCIMYLYMYWTDNKVWEIIAVKVLHT